MRCSPEGERGRSYLMLRRKRFLESRNVRYNRLPHNIEVDVVIVVYRAVAEARDFFPRQVNRFLFFILPKIASVGPLGKGFDFSDGIGDALKIQRVTFHR